MPPLTLACRALGILLAKMIFGATFPNYFGVWEDFHAIHQMRIAGLKARLSETGSGVSEGTHHISLACELVEACLQQIPEDRQVIFFYTVVQVCRVSTNLYSCRDSAEELLYRLRVLEKRDAFVVIADTLGLGPIDFAPRVRGDIRVN